jgi:serine/threonine-protein kinase
VIGKTLGHYQITSQLGKGGMGEVYQAKDQKLGRDVAIKVLPDEFAKDADRVARFQREAKVLASLNHPNIAAIHGLEESGGTNFLVLELVEGETLADRIKAGPITVEESLKLGLQIAEALEAAHDRGVIHRDLKPANIKVTPEGKVKVLDYGLAKAFAGEQESLNLSNSSTLSNAATQQGIILGTAAYMSPDQAKGKTVDKRADIWAFGCVLFEMLTGRSLFAGDDVSQTLARVLERQPDFSTLPRNLHPKILEALKRCLEKETRNRYGSINDARVDIQEALADPSGLFVQPVAVAGPQRKLQTILPWAAATLVIGAIITGLAVWKLKPIEPHQVMRTEYTVPEGQQLGNDVPILAVSPDGKQFVYSTNKGLYVRSLDEFDAKLISGTETNPVDPFFSPDSKWVGYWSRGDNKLKKIAISGGAPVTLCDVSLVVGANWDTDDKIVYEDYPIGISCVSANGGTPEVLLKEANPMLPQLLPDGRSLLFTSGPTPYKIVIQSLQSGERKELFAGDTARYISTGHIIYGFGNNLLAVPFDLKTLKVTGGPIPVVQGVWRAAGDRAPHYAVSDSGTLVYMSGSTSAASPAQRTLVWVDRKGKEVPIAAPPNDYNFPNISPDGTKVALAISSLNKSDIWILDLLRGTITRLTFNETSYYPLWTRDGKRIAFTLGDLSQLRSGVNQLRSAVYWKAADGTGGDDRLVPERLMDLRPRSWSSDGKTLLLDELPISGEAQSAIDALPLEGDRKLTTLLKGKILLAQPKISPDGRWMAYTSNESGKYEVYVRPFQEVNKGKWQVSTSGGDSLLWSPDGCELFYRNGDSVMAVAVETEPTFKPGKTEALFQGKYTSQEWDISPDGKRFLMVKEIRSNASEGGGPRKINVVLNWTEELKQRVPLK